MYPQDTIITHLSPHVGEDLISCLIMYCFDSVVFVLTNRALVVQVRVLLECDDDLDGARVQRLYGWLGIYRFDFVKNPKNARLEMNDAGQIDGGPGPPKFFQESTHSVQRAFAS